MQEEHSIFYVGVNDEYLYTEYQFRTFEDAKAFGLKLVNADKSIFKVDVEEQDATGEYMLNVTVIYEAEVE